MKVTKPFDAVPPGEIYPVTYQPGDECPPELEATARHFGALKAKTSSSTSLSTSTSTSALASASLSTSVPGAVSSGLSSLSTSVANDAKP